MSASLVGSEMCIRDRFEGCWCVFLTKHGTGLREGLKVRLTLAKATRATWVLEHLPRAARGREPGEPIERGGKQVETWFERFPSAFLKTPK
eukprot:15245459-Alexandrium_andersonii.AAC.1